MTTIDQVRAKIRRNYQPLTATLEWVQLSKTTMQSSDKRFTIGKLPDGDQFKYEAFMGKTPIAFKLETFAEAKALCNAHAMAADRNQATTVSSGTGIRVPTPRGSLPNSLGVSDTERLGTCK